MYGLVSVNLKGPLATAAARPQSSGRFSDPSVTGPMTTPAGLLRKRISAFARNASASRRPTSYRMPPEPADEVINHAVGVRVIHVESIQLAIRRQIDAGLTLKIEDDAGGV